MLTQRRRQWANIKPALVERLVFVIMSHDVTGDKYKL